MNTDAGCEGAVAVFSRGLFRLPHLQTLLGADRIFFRPPARQARELVAVAGWGHKPTADLAREYARVHELPYLAVEDGFLRSVGLGRDSPPLSVVVDDAGIYYDSRTPSRLEHLLAHRGPGDPLADPVLIERARRCRARVAEAELSKYNGSLPDLPPGVEIPEGSVLVVDQTRGDASVEQGGATALSFQQMIGAALAEHPYSHVLVKTHPDVIAGRKQGYLTASFDNPRVHVIGENLNPVVLLRRVSHVYTVTSQLGFEAVLLERPVVCFGKPFYAGWGLTDDRARLERRGRPRTVNELAAAALILYPRYVDPVAGQRCEIEETIEHLALQRQMLRANAARCFCFGFRLWKRRFLRSYLWSSAGEVRFAKSLGHAQRLGLAAGDRALVWGSREVEDLSAYCRRHDVERYQVEDGFLRSVGLGSDLTLPASLVMDSRGVYYDPSRPSDLEHLLQHTDFSPDELDRAARLRQRITAAGISKYNPRAQERCELRAPSDQTVIIVPGQVEDDASVRLGGQAIQTNEALLQTVREARPDAYLLYKPHPDVVSGNRAGKTSRSVTDRLCDQVVETATIADCLARAAEVHTLTSLVGFEGLLRGLRVVTYGQPFYSGWGLTEDRSPVERRTRQLTIDELVAGVLIRYPRYYSFRVNAFVRPEDILAELEMSRNAGVGSIPVRVPRAVRQLRRLLALAREVTRAI